MKRQNDRWWALVALAGITTGVLLSLQPWRELRAQKQEHARAKSAMVEAEQEKVDLMRREARYENPAGREELAREQGYRKPNEKSADFSDK